MDKLTLGLPLDFNDLYQTEGLEKLDLFFLNELKESNIELYNQLLFLRSNNKDLEAKNYSNFIITLAPYLEDFFAKLFDIKQEIYALYDKHNAFAKIYEFKRNFIQRKALKTCTREQAHELDGKKLHLQLETLFADSFSEALYIHHVQVWLKENEEEKLQIASLYACWAIFSTQGQKLYHNSIIFKIPNKLDFDHLVPIDKYENNNLSYIKTQEQLHARLDFSLNDAGIDPNYALDQAHYCIYCHNQGKDSCSKGLKNKDNNNFQKNSLANDLTGCPLEEKISEMNYLKSKGHIIGALATIIIDNPMVAATGHRICNDCSKACIYQKQEPVNIPQVETSVLQDVLILPWGFEIYSLLTRWNPLKLINYLPHKHNTYKTLVVGLGPAGFTISHYFLNEGYIVTAIDGLKIEPLPPELSGITPFGKRVQFKPIYSVSELYEPLEDRVPGGFGGVAEYGITVRWNKNHLKILRLLLERRTNFRMYGGTRFGSNITDIQAFELGFDHITLAMGAGKPNIIPFKSGINKGVKMASDFLMNLQLSGAARQSSIANLQIRLPIIVIGGGLTAIDSATEALTYYPIQVEKFLTRYEKLIEKYGKAYIRSSWTEEDIIIADEFITHATALRSEKNKPKPDILKLLNSWGGVTIMYRNSFTNSPSYRINHEEIVYALKEGIKLIENLIPEDIELDRFNACASLISKNIQGQKFNLPAKTILIATGTSPNIIASQEMPKTFKIAGKYFQVIDNQGTQVEPEFISKPNNIHVLTYLNQDHKAISFLGDLHPSFAGNVVKAMASAKQGFTVIKDTIYKVPSTNNLNTEQFFQELDSLLIPYVEQINTLSENIVEILVKAPLAAKNFQPGQFYRFQNYEFFANKVQNTNLAMESIALTGAKIDKTLGTVSMITLVTGGSSSLCTSLPLQEPIILMGPTGTPTHIPQNETVLLIGGGLGNAVLFSIGEACRQNNSKVLYFAGYKKFTDRYKIQEIEEAADQIVWCCDEGLFTDHRPNDLTFHGNIVNALISYATGQLGKTTIHLSEINRIITIGSDKMMFALQQARETSLKPYLNPNHIAIASINSPMQCMMKEICAQCLQKHSDPITKKETYVYSCNNQDQSMDLVDFAYLSNRLSQNSVQEKLTNLWIEHCLS
ncbi:Dihydroorotate dehydrogenase B (NAD(+)), electron transfer subunit [Rickettsiales bacterium Ac37b]|nr:Dihydroorotate dehydrogenase B (NAD(+)), electron transfer subunit [Rickettsiales bacterium Ac37b]